MLWQNHLRFLLAIAFLNKRDRLLMEIRISKKEYRISHQTCFGSAIGMLGQSAARPYSASKSF